MKIIDRLKEDKIHISFEVFPPKTDEGYDKVVRAVDEISRLDPAFISVTYGAGESSFSDDAALLGAPRGFRITVRNLKVSAGAGFLVALTGDIMTMPGLPKVPAAEKIDVDEDGRISGLF